MTKEEIKRKIENLEYNITIAEHSDNQYYTSGRYDDDRWELKALQAQLEEAN